MKPLLIGKTARGVDFKLPVELVTTSLAILAKKRVGKSYTTDVFAEEMMTSGAPVGIIDITGAHWGLKSSADGKSPGHKMVIFGGRHADVPLEENAGAVVARAVVEQRFSFILDFSIMSKSAMKRFLIAFLEEFYRINEEPFHLICDEADRYAPQQPMGDEIRLVAAMDDIVSRGGIKGIGVSIVSQRSAKVNKNIVTQCELLVVLRTVHHLDAKTIMDWIEMHATKEEAAEMLKSLPTLPVGTAWFWWPGDGAANIFEKISVRTRQTFDSGATPKAGEVRRQPKTLAQVDILKLGADIAATVQRAKDNDPTELKKRIKELERQVAAPAKVVSPPERIEVPVLDNATIQLMRTGIGEVGLVRTQLVKLTEEAERLWKGFNDLAAKVAKAPATASSARHIVTAAAPMRQAAATPVRKAEYGTSGGDQFISAGLRRVMISLAHRPGLNNRQLGIRSGISINSSTFRGHLAALRKNEWMRDEGDRRFLTDAGAEALGQYVPLPEGRDLLEHWLRELPPGAAGILNALAAAAPRSLDYEQMAIAGETVVSSSTFRGHMAKLRALELVEDVGRGMTKISEELT